MNETVREDGTAVVYRRIAEAVRGREDVQLQVTIRNGIITTAREGPIGSVFYSRRNAPSDLWRVKADGTGTGGA